MKHITPKELKALMLAENVFLLDVREPAEHDEFNIGGSLLPLGDIMKQAESIPHDQTVIVYCKRGIRSQIAIQRLQEKNGLTNLVNLQGGIEAWKKDN